MDNLLKYDDFTKIYEGKASDVEIFGNYISYHKEIFPGFNYPKRYVGKGHFKYRVLSKEGDKVKPINFGDTRVKIKPMNKLNKKYWDALPYYR